MAQTWPRGGSSRTQGVVKGGSYREAQGGCVSQLLSRVQQWGIQNPELCIHEPQSSDWERGLVETG